MTTNQEGVHAAVRAVTGTSRSYNEDWHALFDDEGIAAGPFNARMLAWINASLSTSYSNLNEAMQAFAVDQGFTNWSSMNTFSVGYSFVNSEAESVVSAFSVQPDDVRKELIDDLVGSLKTAGVWNELDTLYVLAAHDSQAATINWKSPGTYSAVAVNSPTFTTDRGYAGDGATSRLRTQFTPSTQGVKFTLNDASVSLWCVTNVQSNGRAIGSATSPLALIVPRANTDNVTTSINSGSATVIGTGGTMTTSVGLTFVGRSSGGNIAVFKNGASYGTAVSAASSVTSVEQWICAANSTSFSTVRIGMAAWGSRMSGKEADFYTALNTYMTAIGAA